MFVRRRLGQNLTRNIWPAQDYAKNERERGFTFSSLFPKLRTSILGEPIADRTRRI